LPRTNPRYRGHFAAKGFAGCAGTADNQAFCIEQAETAGRFSLQRQQKLDTILIPALDYLAWQAIAQQGIDFHESLGAHAPAAGWAGKATALGYGGVETTGAEDAIASHADHKGAVKYHSFPATALLLGREQVVFHFSDHGFLQIKRC
jgi:hypothetical protein